MFCSPHNKNPIRWSRRARLFGCSTSIAPMPPSPSDAAPRPPSDEELREPAYTLTIGEAAVRVQVPGPIALLKAKITDVAEIP